MFDFEAAVSNLQNPFIKIYPNPTKDVLIVEGFSVNAMASLFDATGKLLLTQKLSSKQINIGHLLSGIYLIRITDKKGVVTKQFVKFN